MPAIGHRSYAALLVAALGTLISMALPPSFGILASVGFSLLLVLQIRLLHRETANAAIDLAFRLVGWLSLASLWLWLLTPSQLRNSGLPLLVLLTLFELQAYPRLIGRLSRERRVTGDVLMGALAGYVLLGLTAALVTALVESLHPGSFRGLLPTGAGDTLAHPHGSTIEEVRFIHVAYFAFVTITTLGFGDVVPITPLARLSTILFSLLGPFYLAVNIGVLIGRYIQQEQSGP